MDTYYRDFLTIDYLSEGTPHQREVYQLLNTSKIMEKLADYTPVLAGTVPLDIAVEGSDLDILCYCPDVEEFRKVIVQRWGHLEGFTCSLNAIRSRHAVVASFKLGGWMMEIYGEDTPVCQQLGYRHLLIEHRVLSVKGDDFREQVITLKRSGLKTEPAFAQLLGLSGDPYEMLLLIDPRFC